MEYQSISGGKDIRFVSFILLITPARRDPAWTLTFLKLFVLLYKKEIFLLGGYEDEGKYVWIKTFINQQAFFMSFLWEY